MPTNFSVASCKQAYLSNTEYTTYIKGGTFNIFYYLLNRERLASLLNNLNGLSVTKECHDNQEDNSLD